MSQTVVFLPGDGIGPEVADAARRVLQELAPEVETREASIGGGAIDATGSPLPDDTLEACRAADASFLGAVGGPKWSDPGLPIRPEQGLLELRAELGLFANLRPVPVFPALAAHAPLRPELLEGVDLFFVRELTGGIYFGPREERNGSDRAFDTMIYTEPEVRRVAHVAFQAARKRRGKVTSVDKANVLASMRLWRAVVEEVATEYPDVELEHQLVDAMAMHLMRRPADFDVILAGNMFGDILSDEAAVLAGSLGLLPSASLSEGTQGLYEPIHGSAPDIAGQGIANPLGAILSVALMLRYSLDRAPDADRIEAAVGSALDEGLRTPDLAGPGEAAIGTGEMTTAVLERLAG